MSKVLIDEKKLRKRMIDFDIKSITELSARSGISKPTIIGYFHGKTPFSMSFLRLCSFLEIDPSELIMLAEEKGEENND